MELSNDEGFYPNVATLPPLDVDLGSLPMSAFYDGWELDHVYDPDCKPQPKSHAKRC
jgi:hypothetical protein